MQKFEKEIRKLVDLKKKLWFDIFTQNLGIFGLVQKLKKKTLTLRHFKQKTNVKCSNRKFST